MIEVPPKIRRPKSQNQYIPLDYGDEIHDGRFNFEYKGKAVWQLTTSTGKICIPARDDLIIYDPILHSTELMKGLGINDNVSDAVKLQVKAIVITYWDCFCEEGACRIMLGYEFAIEALLNQFESNTLIMDHTNWPSLCNRFWVLIRMIGLKKNLGYVCPHCLSCQASSRTHVINIEDFIWRMCVSYRQLDSITPPFEHPIPRYNDAISILIVGSSYIWITAVDACQGYHQVSV